MLNEEQLERYYRTIKLDDIGALGQEKLLNSKVLIVGVGGLGSHTLLSFASLGIGTIGIVDDDIVHSNNLPRQNIYTLKDVNKKKVLCAKKHIKDINKDVIIKTYPYRLDESNGKRIIKNYDIIIDCVDNFETKFLIDDISMKLKKPFITAGVSDYKGQVMTCLPNKSKDFKSLFSELPHSEDDDEGVFPLAVSIIADIAAMEACKYILNIGELLTNQMLVVDTLNWRFQKILIK